jgi:hypothetical protein
VVNPCQRRNALLWRDYDFVSIWVIKLIPKATVVSARKYECTLWDTVGQPKITNKEPQEEIKTEHKLLNAEKAFKTVVWISWRFPGGIGGRSSSAVGRRVSYHYHQQMK